MREANFLPTEIKDRRLKKNKNFINYSIALIFMVNIFLGLHIFYCIHEINLKEKIVSNSASQAFNNSYNKRYDALDFFQENIVHRFLFEQATLNASTLSLKIIIKDKDEFLKCVKDLESIKKCNIEYLIAPYEENTMVKFEVGLKVVQ